MDINTFSDEQLAGQRLMVGFDGTGFNPDLESLINDLKVGGIVLFQRFFWPLTVLVIIFAVESFIVLPLVSRKYCCADCPQKDDCPWMRSIDL